MILERYVYHKNILMPQHKKGIIKAQTIQLQLNIFASEILKHEWNRDARIVQPCELWPKDTDNPSTNLAACQTVGIGNIQFNLESLFLVFFFNFNSLATYRTVVIWNITNSVFKILALYSHSLSVCVSVWVKPLLCWCWFYIFIAQIALDSPPPPCQTGKRRKKVLQTIPSWQAFTTPPPLSDNAHMITTHFKKGLS